MNCERFREIVHDVAREEALGLDASHEALQHAGQCGECDALLQEAQSLTVTLHMLAERYAAEGVSARVEAALVSAVRQNSKPSPALAGLDAGRSRLLQALLLWRFLRSLCCTIESQSRLGWRLSPDPMSVSTAVQAGGAAAISSEDGDLLEGWPVGYDANAPAASFVALSDAFDPTTLDMDSVVRVAISRSALESLGVYLDDLGSDGVVVADLAISGNGAPQAIRLVQW